MTVLKCLQALFFEINNALVISGEKKKDISALDIDMIFL